MLQLGSRAASKVRVNVVKKIKVNGQWKFCAAVIESNGKLRDRVCVNGRTEVHAEGAYYIEWRENHQRRRQVVPNRHEVLEQTRLKTLELEATRSTNCKNKIIPNIVPQAIASVAIPPPVAARVNSDEWSSGAEALLHGIESYFRGLITAAVQSQLSALGVTAVPQLGTAVVCTSLPTQQSQDPASAPNTSHISGIPAEASNQKKLITEAIEGYLKTIEPPQREQKTYDEYRLVLYKFRDSCDRKYLQDINRDDLLAFRTHLFSIGNEARTVFNRMGVVEQLLKRNRITGILEKGDKPKWVSSLREMYQPEDLEALFKVCSPEEKVLYMFFLFTGERDKEVRHTSWDDIDFVRKRVRVTAKKRLGFKPKDKEEREIPVPSLLLTALREYRERQMGLNPNNLVFPTSQGRPDRKFENKLKRIARRGKLNCGHCVSKHENKCSEGPHCSKWFLHKFRHTFATTSLENGVSIRTLQGWLGHSDLESTMTYLKFVQHKDIQKLLDSSEMAEIAAQTLKRNNSGPPIAPSI